MKSGARVMDTDRVMLYARIGTRIRKIRVEKNLSVQALADGAGTFQQMISKIEAGSQSPPVHLLVNIAKTLGVTLDDIVPLGSE